MPRPTFLPGRARYREKDKRAVPPSLEEREVGGIVALPRLCLAVIERDFWLFQRAPLKGFVFFLLPLFTLLLLRGSVPQSRAFGQVLVGSSLLLGLLPSAVIARDYSLGTLFFCWATPQHRLSFLYIRVLEAQILACVNGFILGLTHFHTVVLSLVYLLLCLLPASFSVSLGMIFALKGRRWEPALVLLYLGLLWTSHQKAFPFLALFNPVFYLIDACSRFRLGHPLDIYFWGEVSLWLGLTLLLFLALSKGAGEDNPSLPMHHC